MEILRTPLKGKNPGSFAGKLICPRIAGDGICGGTKWRYVEHLEPYKIRYCCKKCGKTVQYDFSNNPFFMKSVYGKKTDSIFEKVKRKYGNLLKR